MTEKNIKKFEYDGEIFGIDSPDKLAEKISQYFDRETSEEIDCLVKVEKKGSRAIIKDKNYPYSRLEEINQNEYNFFRYNTLIRTTEVNGNGKYKIETYIEGDEGGVLDCFRDYYFKNNEDNVIIHGSLIAENGEGILFTGPKRVGKTTLTTTFMEEMDSKLVSGGITLLKNEDNKIIGHYLPKPNYVRLYPFLNSKLADLMDDIEETYATQPLDEDAFINIKDSGRDDIDANLTISREKYAEKLRTGTKENHSIDKVIVPSYVENQDLKINSLEKERGKEVLEEQIWPKELVADEKIDKNYFEREVKELLSDLDFRTIEFNSKNQLGEDVLKKVIE